MKDNEFSLKAISDKKGWSANNSITFAKPESNYKYWIFYGMKDGVKVIHSIKNCKLVKELKCTVT